MKTRKNNRGTILLAFASLVLAIIVSPIQIASATTVNKVFDGNDCSGFFDSEFDTYNILINDDNKAIELIAKNNEYLILGETNSTLYSNLNGSEFTFNETCTNNEIGDWNLNLGTNDPNVNSLSHLIFYDIIPPHIVPIPALILLLGIGLIGLISNRP